jgi:hypothetical protein
VAVVPALPSSICEILISRMDDHAVRQVQHRLAGVAVVMKHKETALVAVVVLSHALFPVVALKTNDYVCTHKNFTGLAIEAVLRYWACR